MKRLAFLGGILVTILLLGACDFGGPPPCTTNCTTNYNYTLNITVNILALEASPVGSSSAALALPADQSSQQIKLSVIKQDSASGAGFTAFNLPSVTYTLDTNDHNYNCYKSEKAQVGHAPNKYPGTYLVAFPQCGKQAQTPIGRNTLAAASSGPSVLVFSFKDQPCLTLSGGWTLCFPKP